MIFLAHNVSDEFLPQLFEEESAPIIAEQDIDAVIESLIPHFVPMVIQNFQENGHDVDENDEDSLENVVIFTIIILREIFNFLINGV